MIPAPHRRRLLAGGLAVLFFAGIAILLSPSAAERRPARGDPALPARPAPLMLRAAVALPDIEAKLARFPPAVTPARERLQALAGLDAVFQDPEAPDRPAVQQFFHRRVAQAVMAMRRTSVASGAQVWHIYNHGFVVRTPSVTVCFDLVRARYLDGFAIDRKVMAQIVEACDVLFVSHVHMDHAESFVARTFLEQDKPVVAPEQVGYAKQVYTRIAHLERDPARVHRLPVKGGRTTLEVVVYPGHQDADIDNNVVLVRTAEGITVAHLGDQWDKGEDFAWIDAVGRRFEVDILLPNDWTWDVARVVRGFAPAVVIPGHANELGHEIAKRQAYLLSYARKAGSSTAFGGHAGQGYAAPLVVLTWGESYHYPGRAALAAAAADAKAAAADTGVVR